LSFFCNRGLTELYLFYRTDNISLFYYIIKKQAFQYVFHLFFTLNKKITVFLFIFQKKSREKLQTEKRIEIRNTIFSAKQQGKQKKQLRYGAAFFILEFEITSLRYRRVPGA